MSDVRFQPAGDRALMVRFGDRIALDVHQRVRALLQLLNAEPVAGVRNLQPGYTTLLVTFDARALRYDQLESTLRDYVERAATVRLPAVRRVEIPVCYGGEFGPDLDDLARLHDLTAAQVIEMHAAEEYVVYFIGFAPGFAYLGGLREELATPRLANPRWSVPAGSVAIGGRQTAVYPVTSPAGWRLIGRTPLTMFAPKREPMSLLAIGDRVRFVPIEPAQFAERARP